MSTTSETGATMGQHPQRSCPARHQCRAACPVGQISCLLPAFCLLGPRAVLRFLKLMRGTISGPLDPHPPGSKVCPWTRGSDKWPPRSLKSANSLPHKVAIMIGMAARDAKC